MIILPTLAYGVVAAGANEPDSDDAKEALIHFQTAIMEAVADLDLKARAKITRRALRVCEEITLPHRREGGRVDKVGLMLYYLLNWSIECDYLVLHDDTPMRKGLDLLLPGLQHAVEIERLNESAQKAAGKMLKVLQTEGYFQGVTIQ